MRHVAFFYAEFKKISKMEGVWMDAPYHIFLTPTSKNSIKMDGGDGRMCHVASFFL